MLPLEHNHKEASKVKSDDAEGLEKKLLLAEGANVMLNGLPKGWSMVLKVL